jgi:hypothetical protein
LYDRFRNNCLGEWSGIAAVDCLLQKKKEDCSSPKVFWFRGRDLGWRLVGWEKVMELLLCQFTMQHSPQLMESLFQGFVLHQQRLFFPPPPKTSTKYLLLLFRLFNCWKKRRWCTWQKCDNCIFTVLFLIFFVLWGGVRKWKKVAATTAKYGSGTEKAFKSTVELDQLIDTLRNTQYENVRGMIKLYPLLFPWILSDIFCIRAQILGCCCTWIFSAS